MTGVGFDDEARDYDAVLVVSFGGPEAPDEVMPFLDRVLAGRPVPAPVQARIAQRYARFGGVSPINARTREFIAALEGKLADGGPRLPVYWGNRNSAPLLPDTLRRMADDGIESAIAYVTSMFSSYSGCRQYREDLFRAGEGMAGVPRIDKLRVAYNHPGFIDAMVDRVREARAMAPSGAALLFTAHSLPLAMAAHADYESQLHDACALVARRLGGDDCRLAFQSGNTRSGDPWLRPTLQESLATLRATGARAVLVAPIGFVCDHMEVVVDLDVEARACAEGLGLGYFRARTVGTHPAYVDMVVRLIVERMSANPERPYLGQRGPNPDYCAPDCCLSGRSGEALPTVGGLGAARPEPR